MVYADALRVRHREATNEVRYRQQIIIGAVETSPERMRHSSNIANANVRARLIQLDIE